MKIRIVGGGWYGCYITKSLMDDGHEVRLFERGAALFNGASGANQSRLHLGFHYPRDGKTRTDAVETYREWMNTYPELAREIPCNIYAIAEDKSYIDFGTYTDTMRASGAEFITLEPGDHDLQNIEGAVLTGERLILANHARRMWERLLAGHYECGVTVEHWACPEWDATIDCTYGANVAYNIDRYEPCVLFLYEGPTDRAVTIMDGPFGASLYPYPDDGIVSLTSVEHTPLAKCRTWGEAQTTIERLTTADLAKVRAGMVTAISDYVPWFRDVFRHVGHAISTRALPASMADRRTVMLTEQPWGVSVLPGKMSGIFRAERAVKAWLSS